MKVKKKEIKKIEFKMLKLLEACIFLKAFLKIFFFTSLIFYVATYLY